MRRWRAMASIAGAGALGVLAVIGPRDLSPRVPVAQAQAAKTFDVTVGTDVQALALETMAFFPGAVTVNAGDTVNWRFAGFHTVTFPSGQPIPPLFTPGPGGDVIVGPGFGPLPAGPTPPGGAYNGRSLISSGTPQDDPADAPPFSLTFTAAGVYNYLCTLHPGMEGVVTVVPAGAALPETAAQATARGTVELESVIAAAKMDAPGGYSSRTTTRGGVSVYTIAAGVAFANASKLAFLPGDLTIRRGDVVTFTNPDLYTIHTVTFTSGGADPEFVQVRFGPGGPGSGPPTLTIAANVAGPVGGTTYTGQGYVNSGILGPGQSFALTFDAPAGGYEYLCVVHPFMKNTITVTE